MIPVWPDSQRFFSFPSLRTLALGYPARLTYYGIITFLVGQVVFMAARRWGIVAVTSENGPVEHAQALMAAFASICIFFAAWKMPVGRTGLIFCAAMVGYAAGREYDKSFETYLFDDAYKTIVGLPLFLIVIYSLWKGRKVVFHEAGNLARMPSMTIYMIAGIYIAGVCQVLDRPDFWTEIGTSLQARQTMAAIEEYAELFGYLLMAFSGFEALIMALSVKQEAVSVEPESILRVIQMPEPEEVPMRAEEQRCAA